MPLVSHRRTIHTAPEWHIFDAASLALWRGGLNRLLSVCSTRLRDKKKNDWKIDKQNKQILPKVSTSCCYGSKQGIIGSLTEWDKTSPHLPSVSSPRLLLALTISFTSSELILTLTIIAIALSNPQSQRWLRGVISN